MVGLQKRICLLTNRPDVSDCHCSDEKYSISIMPVDQNRHLFLSDDLSGFDYCFIDTKSCNIFELGEVLTTSYALCHFICISDQLDSEDKGFLLKYGIVDVIKPGPLSDIISYAKSIETGTEISSGKFLILEDNPVRKSAIDRIISRFGYTTLYAKTSEEMQQCAEQANVQYILLNLGIEYKELSDFVKTYNTRVEMRRIPVISYTDLSDGVFIHEVIRGLNKLTRFVLNPEELYSFLVDEMFKKDIIPLLDGLNISLAFKECSLYARESLKRIYYINEGNLFHSPGIMDSENINNMQSMLELMSLSLSRINGLKWLVSPQGSECVPTCGVSAAGQHHL